MIAHCVKEHGQGPSQTRLHKHDSHQFAYLYHKPCPVRQAACGIVKEVIGCPENNNEELSSKFSSVDHGSNILRCLRNRITNPLIVAWLLGRTQQRSLCCYGYSSLSSSLERTAYSWRNSRYGLLHWLCQNYRLVYHSVDLHGLAKHSSGHSHHLWALDGLYH